MIILGPNPANSPRSPACRAKTLSLWVIEPTGPCPLLTWLSSVSAGYETIVNQFNEVRECKAYMAKNCSRKTSNDSAPQLDGKFRCSRQVFPCFLRHSTESDFMAKFIHGELPDSVRNLSTKDKQHCMIGLMRSLNLQIIGKKPAYISRSPPSLARRVKPETRPVA